MSVYYINIFKILLSILLLLCLADMPCGYFQLVRYMALIGFGILAYDANQKQSQTEKLTFIFLAVLFQPFIKLSLG